MPTQKIYYNNRTGCFTIRKTNNCPSDVNFCIECFNNKKYCDCVCDKCVAPFYYTKISCDDCRKKWCNK